MNISKIYKIWSRLKFVEIFFENAVPTSSKRPKSEKEQFAKEVFSMNIFNRKNWKPGKIHSCECWDRNKTSSKMRTQTLPSRNSISSEISLLKQNQHFNSMQRITFQFSHPNRNFIALNIQCGAQCLRVETGKSRNLLLFIFHMKEKTAQFECFLYILLQISSSMAEYWCPHIQYTYNKQCRSHSHKHFKDVAHKSDSLCARWAHSTKYYFTVILFIIYYLSNRAENARAVIQNDLNRQEICPWRNS